MLKAIEDGLQDKLKRSYVAPGADVETRWGGGYDRQDLYFTVAINLPKGSSVTSVRGLEAVEISSDGRELSSDVGRWWESGQYYQHVSHDWEETTFVQTTPTASSQLVWTPKQLEVASFFYMSKSCLCFFLRLLMHAKASLLCSYKFYIVLEQVFATLTFF